MENRKPAEQQRNPAPRGDELNSWEYLSEHLYQKTLKGGYEEEFATCQAYIPALEPFQNLRDFIQAVEKDSSLKEQVMADIKKLWPAHYEIRPSLGIVLLMAMWSDLPMSRLEDFYYDLLTEVLGGGDGDA